MLTLVNDVPTAGRTLSFTMANAMNMNHLDQESLKACPRHWQDFRLARWTSTSTQMAASSRLEGNGGSDSQAKNFRAANYLR